MSNIATNQTRREGCILQQVDLYEDVEDDVKKKEERLVPDTWIERIKKIINNKKQ